MKFTTLLISLTLGLSLTSAALQADDTDIYYAPTSGSGADIPMVMLNMDLRPNVGSTICNSQSDCESELGTELYQMIHPDIRNNLGGNNKFTLQQLFVVVLYKVLSELVTLGIDIKIGVMLGHEDTSSGCAPGDTGCGNGAFIMEGFKLLDQAYADQIKAKLDYISIGIDQNNGDSGKQTFQGKEMYFELFRYLTGGGVYNAHLGWATFDGNQTSGDKDHIRQVGDDWAPITWDPNIEDGSNNYISPLLAAGACSGIYVINVLHQVSQQEDDSDAAIAAATTAGGTGATRQTFPDMIAFMHGTDLGDSSVYPTAPDLDGDQGVISYFLSQHVNANDTGKVNGYAQAGGTGQGYNLDVPTDELLDLLLGIFAKILSVSSTFVSGNLPVDAFNEAAVLNDLLFAMFKVDPNDKPDWPGNIKRLEKDDANNTLLDANGVNAIDTDNRIKHSALTFWTDPNGADVQAANVLLGEVSGKDGRSVKRGGAGQQIPGFLSGNPGDDNSDTGARKMFTEPDSFTNGTPENLLAFNADSSDTRTARDLRDDLGVKNIDGDYDADSDGNIDDVDNALGVMRWLRGQDSADADVDSDRVERRDWIMGDVLHSRPLVVNYGSRGAYTDTNQDVRILAGTNHGVLHMFTNAASDGDPTGSESWAFLPRDTLSNSSVLRLNAAGGTHPYGVDGPVSVLINDSHDGEISGTDTVWAYFGLRRGGKAYYALDISDPDVPKLLWKVDSDDSDTDRLGLTFSPIRTGTIWYDTNPVQAIFVAGGYDGNKDLRPGPGTDDTQGNAVYVLNAETGDLIWKAEFHSSDTKSHNDEEYRHAEMKDGIVAEIGLIDVNADGIIDRAYVPDTGGRLWRMDMPQSATEIRDKWSVTLLADLGRHDAGTGGGIPNDRRFFHGVDVSKMPGDPTTWYIALGSGDRANPKETSHVNGLAVIKDPYGYTYDTSNNDDGKVNAPIGELPLTVSDLEDITDNCIQEDTCSGTPDLSHGWYLTLGQGTGFDGEKMLSSPLIANQTIFFTTYLPNAGSASLCEPNEGGGIGYAVRLDNGGAAYNTNPGNDDSCNNDDGLCSEDRVFVPKEEMPDGIPSDPVPIPPNKILIGTKLKAIGKNNTERTFWYQIEDVNTPN